MKVKMKYIKHFLFTLAIGLILISCDEVINLDIDDSEEQVVIEGLITNSDLNFIKVSRSRAFYASGPAEGIEDATVVVTDQNGTEFVFSHNPDNVEGFEGVYLAPPGFTGVIDHTYSMSVIAEGVEYNAQEKLLPVTSIDSLTVEYADLDPGDEEFEDFGVEEGELFEVIFFAQEPQDRVDHYLFKFYRNDSLVKDFPEDIYFSEDEFLGEEIDDLPIASYYLENDTVRVEMYSITREAFVFYADLFNLINGDGGMFSPPPANPRNNLSNGALGYFQVSAIDTETIIVKDPGD